MEDRGGLTLQAVAQASFRTVVCNGTGTIITVVETVCRAFQQILPAVQRVQVGGDAVFGAQVRFPTLVSAAAPNPYAVGWSTASQAGPLAEAILQTSISSCAARRITIGEARIIRRHVLAIWAIAGAQQRVDGGSYQTKQEEEREIHLSGEELAPSHGGVVVDISMRRWFLWNQVKLTCEQGRVAI
jgi:hypothetical protein